MEFSVLHISVCIADFALFYRNVKKYQIKFPVRIFDNDDTHVSIHHLNLWNFSDEILCEIRWNFVEKFTVELHHEDMTGTRYIIF